MVSVALSPEAIGKVRLLRSDKFASRSGNLTAATDRISILFAIAICMSLYLLTRTTPR